MGIKVPEEKKGKITLLKKKKKFNKQWLKTPLDKAQNQTYKIKQEAQRTSNRKKLKKQTKKPPCPDTISKLLNTKNKENILKVATHTHPNPTLNVR